MSAPTRSAPPPPPPDEDEGGASANERLLAAAKTDNEGLFEEAIDEVEDVNYADGMGNTALHYAIQNASTSVLDHLLNHDTCDVDPRNRLNGDTPLHLAIKGKWEDHEGLRVYLVEQLLEAGASTSYNERPIDLLPPTYPGVDAESDDEKIRAAIRRSEAQAALGDRGDVVDEDDLVDPDDVASDSD